MAYGAEKPGRRWDEWEDTTRETAVSELGGEGMGGAIVVDSVKLGFDDLEEGISFFLQLVGKSLGLLQRMV